MTAVHALQPQQEQEQLIAKPQPAAPPPLTCWERLGVCCGCVAATSMAAATAAAQGGLSLVAGEPQAHVEARLQHGSAVRAARARALLFPDANRGARVGTLHCQLVEVAGVGDYDLLGGADVFATLRLGAQWQRSAARAASRGIRDADRFGETRRRVALGDQCARVRKNARARARGIFLAGIRETSLSLRYVFDAYDETPVLVLELWDEDMKARVAVGDVRRQLGADDHIGRCHVALQTLLDHTAHDRWYALEGPKDAAGEPRGGVGKVRVRLLFKPAGVMHCDGACATETRVVAMVEADAYARRRSCRRGPSGMKLRPLLLSSLEGTRPAARGRARARADRRAQRVLGGVGDGARAAAVARGQVRRGRLGDQTVPRRGRGTRSRRGTV